MALLFTLEMANIIGLGPVQPYCLLWMLLIPKRQVTFIKDNMALDLVYNSSGPTRVKWVTGHAGHLHHVRTLFRTFRLRVKSVKPYGRHLRWLQLWAQWNLAGQKWHRDTVGETCLKPHTQQTRRIQFRKCFKALSADTQNRKPKSYLIIRQCAATESSEHSIGEIFAISDTFGDFNFDLFMFQILPSLLAVGYHIVKGK